MTAGHRTQRACSGAVAGDGSGDKVSLGWRYKHERRMANPPYTERTVKAHRGLLLMVRGWRRRWLRRDFRAMADLWWTAATSRWSYSGVDQVETWRRGWIEAKPIQGCLSPEGGGNGGNSIKSWRAGRRRLNLFQIQIPTDFKSISNRFKLWPTQKTHS
jgi:hypothetical protein